MASVGLSLIMAALLTACGGGGSRATYSAPAPAQKFATKVGSTSGQATNVYNKGSTSNDYKSPVSSSSFTQASQANANTIYATVAAGNSTWNDTIHRFDATADKALTYEKNFSELQRTGILQVFAQRDVTTSRKSNARLLGFEGRDIYEDTPTNTQLAKVTLDGTGVNVAIIDGKSLNEHRDFAHKPVEIEFKADTSTASFFAASTFNADSNSNSSTSSTSNDTLLEATGKHGTFVGLVIAGKRGTQGPGIAPGVQLATLALRNADLNTGNYFKLVQQHNFTSTGKAVDGTDFGKQVHIISNSYSLGLMLRADKEYYNKLQNSPAVNLTADTDSSNDKGLEVATTFSSLYNVLNEWDQQPATAPLVVFASGNIDKPDAKVDRFAKVSRTDSPYVRFLKSYVDHDYYVKTTEERKNTQPNVSEATRTALLNPYFVGTATKINTSNYHTSENVLTNLLKFPKIADNTLVVTGYTANDTGKNSEIVKRIKQYVLDGTIDSKNVLTEVETNWKTIQPTLGSFEKVILNPGAIACGDLKYSCLAASFTYNFPTDENGKTTDNAGKSTATSKSGTSFSAPQVSAVAALVKQQFDWMNAAQLKHTILTTALDAGPAGVDDVFGWGLLNGIGAVNGPMLFNAGDFEAKLDRVTSVGKNYYFNNNIYGSGGLRVSGGAQDYLYLTGVNSFTGDLVVDSANLVVVNRYVAGITQPECSSTTGGRCYIKQPYITANTYVNSNGKLFAVHANFAKNLTVNGLASLAYTKVGNFTLKRNATLLVDMRASNNRIDVEGTAEIQGNIKFINSNYYTPSSTQDYTFLRAGNLNYKGQVVVDDQGLINTDVYQDGKLLGIRATARTPIKAAPTLASATGLGAFDSDIVFAGAHNLEGLFVQADALASRDLNATTSTSFTENANASTAVNAVNWNATAPTATTTGDNTVTNAVDSATSATSAQGANLATSADNLLVDDWGDGEDASQFLSQFQPTAVSEWYKEQGITLSEAMSDSSTSSTSTTDNAPSNSAATSADASVSTVSSNENTTPAPQDLRLVAGQLQKLTSAQQATIFAGMAGTSYASLQQLATYGLRNSVFDFSRAVQQAPLGRQAYTNFVSSSQHYHNNASQISADAQQYLMGAGVTTQWHGLNLGLAAHVGKLELSEYFNGSAAARLNSGTGDTYSVTGGVAYNTPHYYITGNLALATHSLKTTREKLGLAEHHGDLRTNQALVNLGAGYRLYQEGAWQVTLGAGLTGILSHQNSFSETTLVPYWDELSLHGTARTNLASYLNLEGTVSYELPLLYDTRSHLEVQVQSSTALSGNDWGVDVRATNAGANAPTQRSSQVFGLDFTTKLLAGWNIQVAPGVQLRLAGQYLHTSNFDEKTAQSQLFVKF